MESAPISFSMEDPEDLTEAYHGADEAANGLQAAIRAGRVKVDIDADLKIFAAPQEPNSRFIVRPGKIDRIRFNNDMGYRDLSRDLDGGDVWAEFHAGICATRDPDVIEWCMAHSGDEELHLAYHENSYVAARECPVDFGLCRDVDWPHTTAWADLKILQISTSRRAAQLPASTNVDEMFKRVPTTDGSHGEQGTTIQNAATAARNADRQRTKGR